MFRLSNLIASVLEEKPSRKLNGTILIWNFTNRCNLSCLHCYSKADLTSRDFLSTELILKTIPELKNSGVRFVIFSGGEPLTRKDIFQIAQAFKEEGIMTYLSTNGLYINPSNTQAIIDHFDYIGVSIDGREEIHDRFRGLKGSFAKSLEAVRYLEQKGARAGIRFTVTKETLESLPFIFGLAEEMKISKLYISHLVYSGRGLENQAMDLDKKERREAVDFILKKAFEYYENGTNIDIVTGNMEPDAAYFLQKFASRYPAYAQEMKRRLLEWGGNSAGRNLVNIDSQGNVKPDPFFPIILGNITQKPFGQIWNDPANDLLIRLREQPRQIKGHCSSCRHLALCNGGSRSRAFAIFNDLWMEDPSCYLGDDEIKESL